MLGRLSHLFRHWEKAEFGLRKCSESHSEALKKHTGAFSKPRSCSTDLWPRAPRFRPQVTATAPQARAADGLRAERFDNPAPTQKPPNARLLQGHLDCGANVGFGLHGSGQPCCSVTFATCSTEQCRILETAAPGCVYPITLWHPR